MFLHMSVCPWGVVSQHALQVSGGGGIPACLAGLQGVVSRPTPGVVSRPTPRGVLQAHTQGASRPTPGVVSRPTPRGLQAHTQGVSQHVLRQTPPCRWLLPRVVRIILECILVHDMHSQCHSLLRKLRRDVMM